MNTKIPVFLLALFFCFQTAFSQNTDWKILKTEQGVTLSYQVVPCGTQFKLLLKADNANAEEKKVQWKVNCKNAKGETSEWQSEAILPAKSSLSGECEAARRTKHLSSTLLEQPNAVQLISLLFLNKN
jgi:hypothetical protein